MKIKIFLTVLALIATVIAFFLGVAIGKRNERTSLMAAWDYMSKANAVGAFHTYDNILKKMGEGRSEYAACLVEMYASIHFDEVQRCLNDSQCRSEINSHVQKVAPQLMAPSPSDIRRFAQHRGCSDEKR
jgi:hypothetical protein